MQSVRLRSSVQSSMFSIKTPRQFKQRVIALGADLKCRPALAQADRVTLLDEIGDLAFPENQDALEDLLAHHSAELVLCDRHPGYFSNELAHLIASDRRIAVHELQHHRAHVAAVCLELGLYEETVVGLAFDGTGYGDDGKAWGGEFFVGSLMSGFERKAHFALLPLPGGDAAVREPWRIALALLVERGASPAMIRNWVARRQIPVNDLAVFQKALEVGFAVGRSSALGRWFDAASALLGIGTIAAFEAQPAIKLQKIAEENFTENPAPGWPYEVRQGDLTIIDFPQLTAAAESADNNIPALAAAFHLAVSRATAEVAGQLAHAVGTNLVVASGGCFLNALFDRLLSVQLSSVGLRYLKPKSLPPGDQAIALGQVGLALPWVSD